MQKIDIKYYIAQGNVCAKLTCIYSSLNDRLKVFSAQYGYSECKIISDLSWKSLEYKIQQLLKDVPHISKEREKHFDEEDKKQKKYTTELSIKEKELAETQPKDHIVIVDMTRTI